MFPKHLLDAALKGGTFGTAWGVGTPHDQIAGLGPFVVSEYARDSAWCSRAIPATGGGRPRDALPYLDRVTLEIVPDQDSEVLRLDAGSLDMTATELRAEDYTALKRATDAGR